VINDWAHLLQDVTKQMLEELVKAGADINATTSILGTPLMMAVWQKKLPVVKLLLGGLLGAPPQHLLVHHGAAAARSQVKHADASRARSMPHCTQCLQQELYLQATLRPLILALLCRAQARPAASGQVQSPSH
jgi:hypothetical protein